MGATEEFLQRFTFQWHHFEVNDKYSNIYVLLNTTWLTKYIFVFQYFFSIFLSKDLKGWFGFTVIINLWYWTCDPIWMGPEWYPTWKGRIHSVLQNCVLSEILKMFSLLSAIKIFYFYSLTSPNKYILYSFEPMNYRWIILRFDITRFNIILLMRTSSPKLAVPYRTHPKASITQTTPYES